MQYILPVDRERAEVGVEWDTAVEIGTRGQLLISAVRPGDNSRPGDRPVVAGPVCMSTRHVLSSMMVGWRTPAWPDVDLRRRVVMRGRNRGRHAIINAQVPLRPARWLLNPRLLTCCLFACGSVPGLFADELPLHERIDALVRQACVRGKVPLAAPAADAEFLRRLSLDLTGVVPTAEVTQQFIDDQRSDKRVTMIDRLLASPEFALNMSRVFDAMLLERRIATIKSYDFQTPAWRDWLAEEFRDNRPWDELVRRILASDGTHEQQGVAAKFYLVRDVEPHLVSRDIGRILLGINLECAQCHDDPRIEAYQQTDYYGIYAFVDRLKHVRNDETKRNFVEEKAESKVTFTSAFSGAAGWFPGGRMLAEPELKRGGEYKVKPEKGRPGIPVYSRRAELVKHLPNPGTRGFSRNIANRVWNMMMGRGLVHPLDMHHPQNPASHPELLSLLTSRIEASGFDIRGLVRDLALTETYQRSSLLPVLKDQATDPLPAHFAVAAIRPLSPEQFAWSVLQVSGRLPDRLLRDERRREQQHEAATTAEPATDTQAAVVTDWELRKRVYSELRRSVDPVVEVFANLPGQAAGDFQPSVDQALFLLNGEPVFKLLDGCSLLERLVKLEQAEPLAEQLYLAVLSRHPTAGEVEELRQRLKSVSERRGRAKLLRAIVWGHLLSAEFRLNH